MAGMVKGPAIFLNQFAGDTPPFNSFDGMCGWAASLGYKGVQIPTWVDSLIDISKAAESQTYCDELAGTAKAHGLAITELASHVPAQLVAVNPAYDEAFDGFAPKEVRGKPAERQKWAVEHMMKCAKASKRLGLSAHPTFSGALAWPFLYPWPQRPAGLIETAFEELAKRWKPILDAFDDAGCDVAYELHPGEDLFDGATFERFLDAVGGHKRCAINYDPSHFVLQQLDYLEFIDIYHERIKAFHVKDAEFNPTGRQGVYSGYVRRGSSAPGASVRSATGRSTSTASSPSSRNTAIRPGRCWSGNAASSTPRTARARAPSSLSITSSASPTRRSTISPAAQSTRSRSSARSGSTEEKRAMAIEGRSDAKGGRRIRLGMVGGGEGAFIGAVHRIASRIDDQYELVAGALSSTPDKARRSGEALGLAADRIYDDYESMAKAEAKRPDGIEAVAIVTPNHMHAGPTFAFLKAGIHVICDKPLTVSLAEAKKMKAAVEKSGRIFALTHNYTGYPLVRRMREMVQGGDLGEIRLVQVEYPQDWLTGPTEKTGNKQAEWRIDPKRSGAGGALGDIGTHAFNLADYVTGPRSRRALGRSHRLRRGTRRSTTTSRS